MKQPSKALLYGLIFTAGVAVIILPQAMQALTPEAGINAYASDWRTHAFLFSVLEDVLLVPLPDPGQAARVTVAAIMIALVAYLALRFGDRTTHLPSLWAAIIAALIFLSPTGYPWYLIWLAPFLPFLPQAGLIAVFALAPLYWLRFQLGDEDPVYQWVVVPIAFGVPLSLIVAHYLNRRLSDAIYHRHSRAE